MEHLEESKLGIGSTLFNNFAISYIAIAVSSPASKDGTVLFSGFDKIDIIFVAAYLRWSFKVTLGNGISYGKNSIVL